MDHFVLGPGVHVNSFRGVKQQSKYSTEDFTFLRSHWRVRSSSINHPLRADINHKRTEMSLAPPGLGGLHGEGLCKARSPPDGFVSFPSLLAHCSGEPPLIK